MPALLALFLLLAGAAAAGTLRVATYNVDLSAEGPGLLLQELVEEPGPKALAAIAAIREIRPDILVLQQIDHDLRGFALAAFAARLAEGEDGVDYPHRFAPPVNAGVASGQDLDGDGAATGWGDGHGWGKFPGHGGMAILSRLPLDAAAARTFRSLAWEALPGARLPARADGAPFLPPGARLSSRSHWDVPAILPDGGRLHLLTAHPTPPLFDGPKKRNRLRNADEVRFWSLYLDGTAFADDAGRVAPAPDAPVILLGDFNLDPEDGAGEHAAIRALLAHPRLRDAAPESAAAAEAARAQGGANARQSGPAARDTADWRDDPGPGNLRVDYILPDARLRVLAAGLARPPGAPGAAAPPHALVWADVETGAIETGAAGALSRRAEAP